MGEQRLDRQSVADILDFEGVLIPRMTDEGLASKLSMVV